MDLTIVQSCPSCGASIVLSEDDRLIRCAYCDVNNYRLDTAAARYLLPSTLPASISPEQLFYIPYLRFKGMVFYVSTDEVGHKIVDTTWVGIEEESLARSLGLRPQAMQLKPVIATTEGKFIQQTVATKEAFLHAAMVTALSSQHSEKVIYHRAFIGETLSRIYQPCYLREDLIYDAVLHKPMGPGDWLDRHVDQSSSSRVSWEPQFISTICPECSALLSGERDSLVLHCQNCESLWYESGGKFQPLSWQVVESEEPSSQYLPFWRIAVTARGSDLQSFGDYLRFTNQPVVVDKRFDHLPLSFWIPAFKLRPKTFLQVAAQLTVCQWRIPSEIKKSVIMDHPVTLGQNEASQAIKSVLAVTTLNKRMRLPLLPQVVLSVRQCDLIYLPFSENSHDLIQEHTATAISAATLNFGRKL